jgi:2-hydroxychromene-2-carboxylate isomerase
MPPCHPYNPLPSLRLCVAAGSQIHHVKTVFDLIYGQGIQPDSLEGIQATAKALGISDPVAIINDSDVKTKLRENTELAIAEGVFGVPSFVVSREVFWGGDATDMLLNYLDNPNLFKTSEMTRISTMPMGVKRKIVS